MTKPPKKQTGFKSSPDSQIAWTTRELADKWSECVEKDPETFGNIEGILKRMTDYRAANPELSQEDVHKEMPRFFWAELVQAELPFGDHISEPLLWESDRGCVLVVAAIIDETLKDLLTAFFKSRSDVSEDELHFMLTKQPQPPLQSTGLKIRYAHMCGLIDRKMLEALTLIQRLRSKTAAHSRHAMRISRKDVEPILKCLPESFSSHLTSADAKLLNTFLRNFGDNFAQTISQSKFEFALAAEFLIWLIEQEIEKFGSASE